MGDSLTLFIGNKGDTMIVKVSPINYSFYLQTKLLSTFNESFFRTSIYYLDGSITIDQFNVGNHQLFDRR